MTAANEIKDGTRPQYPNGPHRSLLVTFAMAFIPGCIGLFGLGHFYVGKPYRGIPFLVLGGTLAVWMIFIDSDNYTHAFLFVSLSFMVLWSSLDAVLQARQYNTEGQATGIAPW